ncbi:MAG TPA: cytochrome c [Methylomirabilota bacterium]|jgi:mono/diheme cytochrome c family protein
MLDRRVLAPILLAAALTGCSGQGSSLSPEAERGRQVYVAQCTSCHAADPARDGPVGPAVKGASRELLEARVLRGAYPPGYTPKRPSAVMQPLPQLAGSLDDLAAYLR